MIGAEWSTLPDLERSFSIEYSIPKIEKITEKFLHEHEVSLVQKEENLKSYVVAKKGNDDFATGYGKGSHANIGAFGECIEHFHILDTAINHQKYIENVTINSLYQNDVFMRVGSNLHHTKPSIATLEYLKFDSKESANFPFAFVNGDFYLEDDEPTASEEFFQRYASSSGTAFGFSFEDALLHATLEVIERHEISRLFLNLLNQYSDQTPYQLIDTYNFHEQITDLSNEVKSKINDKALISLVRKSEIGPYFSFTFFRKVVNGKERTVWGAGCSLYRDLAIYRSVAECQQTMDYDGLKVDDQVDKLASRFASLRAVETIDISKINYHPHVFEPSPIEVMSVSRQLKVLSEMIKSSGRELLHYTHTTKVKDYYVVNALISDTERFFGIIFAIPVLPIGHLKKYDPREFEEDCIVS